MHLMKTVEIWIATKGMKEDAAFFKYYAVEAECHAVIIRANDNNILQYITRCILLHNIETSIQSVRESSRTAFYALL